MPWVVCRALHHLPKIVGCIHGAGSLWVLRSLERGGILHDLLLRAGNKTTNIGGAGLHLRGPDAGVYAIPVHGRPPILVQQVDLTSRCARAATIICV